MPPPPERIPRQTIELSDDEARQFIQFQKYFIEFYKLVDSGVFNLKGTQVTLHFDADGKIRMVEKVVISKF